MVNLARQAHQCNNSVVNIMGIANYFLFGFKLYPTRQNPYLAPLSGQQPMARQVAGSWNDSTTIVVQYCRGIKLCPNDFSLYQINLSFHPNQINFCLQQIEVNTQIHSLPKAQRIRNCRMLCLKGIYLHTPSSRGSGIITEEGSERV